MQWVGCGLMMDAIERGRFAECVVRSNCAVNESADDQVCHCTHHESWIDGIIICVMILKNRIGFLDDGAKQVH